MVKRHIGWLFITLHVLMDGLIIVAGFSLAWWLRYIVGIGGTVGTPNFIPLESYSGMRLGLVAVILLVFVAAGVYRMPRGRSFLVDASQILHAILLSLGLLVVALFMVRIPFSSRLLLGYAGVAVSLLLLVERLIERIVQRFFWRRGLGVVRVLVVGDGMAARDVMRHLLLHPADGRKLWGCLAVDAARTGEALLVDAGQPLLVPVYGGVNDLDRVMIARNIRQVIIALPGSEAEATKHAVRTCIQRDVDFRLTPELYGIAAQQVSVDSTYGRPVLQLRERSMGVRRPVTKRMLDILLSLLVLVPIGGALMLLIAILIKLDSPGPVFFRQKRMTRAGSVFWVYKFRSMRANAEHELEQLKAANEASGPIFKMRDDPRLTRVGKWLRRTSLDELPQVFNILMGEMSWVGPRPPLPSEVDQYEEWHKRRLGTTTGLTGLWQISGRSLLTFDEMVKLDLYYVENWSIWLDLKILLKTIPSVFSGKGAF